MGNAASAQARKTEYAPPPVDGGFIGNTLLGSKAAAQAQPQQPVENAEGEQ